MTAAVVFSMSERAAFVAAAAGARDWIVSLGLLPDARSSALSAIALASCARITADDATVAALGVAARAFAAAAPPDEPQELRLAAAAARAIRATRPETHLPQWACTAEPRAGATGAGDDLDALTVDAIVAGDDETIERICAALDASDDPVPAPSARLLAARAFASLRAYDVETGGRIARTLARHGAEPEFVCDVLRFFLAQQRSDGAFGHLNPLMRHDDVVDQVLDFHLPTTAVALWTIAYVLAGAPCE